VLAGALAYAPWPVRNQLVLRAPVPFTTSGGFNLCDGVSSAGTPALWEEMSGWRGAGELEIDRRWHTRYRALRGGPVRQAARFVANLVRFFVPLERTPDQLVYRAIAFVALAGALLALGTGAGTLLAVAWLGQGFINALANVSARYRFPAEWIAAACAAIAYAELRRRLAPRAANLALAALVGLGALVLVAQLLRPR
jgi:hypothetical protein